MLGLDTNVLVRFLVRDHEVQFQRARRLIKREVGSDEAVSVSLPVLLETGSGAAQPLRPPQNRNHGNHFSGLPNATDLGARNNPPLRSLTSGRTAPPRTSADCLIGAHHRRLGCRATASFDARAVKLPGFVAADGLGIKAFRDRLLASSRNINRPRCRRRTRSRGAGATLPTMTLAAACPLHPRRVPVHRPVALDRQQS